MELALQHNFSFSKVHKLVVLVGQELDFHGFNERIMKGSSVEKDRHENIFLPDWRSIHNISHLESTCPLRQDGINQVKYQMGWFE